MERLKIALFGFLLFQQISTTPTRSSNNFPRVISFISNYEIKILFNSTKKNIDFNPVLDLISFNSD